MEIKFKTINYFFIIYTFISLNLISDDVVEKIDFNATKKNDLYQFEISNRSISQKDPIKGINIDVSKIISLSSSNIVFTNFSELNKSTSDINQINSLKLLPGQYIEIVGIDKKRKLFDGSLILQFDDIPNMVDFAELNDLVLVKNLSDISIGVFKVKNILDIEIKLKSFKEDSNILSIDLDTIDPTLKLK